MQTKSETPDTPGPLFHPLTGWEAASRWNSAAFEWMTKGLQQWLSLVATSLDPAAARVSPAKLEMPKVRAARSSRAQDSRLGGNDVRERHAVAKESARASDKSRPKRPARPKKPAARSRSRS